MSINNVFLAGGLPKPEKPASDVLDTRQGVSVYHPGYNSRPLLLFLVAFLTPSGSCGVPFSVVLDACRILANNKDGTLRVMDDDIDLTTPDRSLTQLFTHTTHHHPLRKDLEERGTSTTQMHKGIAIAHKGDMAYSERSQFL
ncbi:hypothetical protein DFH08DRAFT_803747 [Mycena albidolilacea]|uniref:Uncharacterized protein n=1 Tax=Mycena albidolilacea TaxID=1033008 RepID=A0AAD7ADH5_9AGAR|nr:hypothetical protein DFH08DRAFT_803747 [Mycena albidolilacea]